jgi:hypothetical protein
MSLFSGYTDVYYWNRDCDAFITVNQGGTSCFAPATLVVTTKGPKKISEIQIGDIVKTYDINTDTVQYKEITDTFSFDNTKKTVRLTLKNGISIVCTDDHKFYINGEWLPIKEVLCKQKMKK